GRGPARRPGARCLPTAALVARSADVGRHVLTLSALPGGPRGVPERSAPSSRVAPRSRPGTSAARPAFAGVGGRRCTARGAPAHGGRRAGSRPAPGAGLPGGAGALSVVAPTLVRDGTGMEMLGAAVVGGRSRAGLGRRSAQRADLGETGGLRG